MEFFNTDDFLIFMSAAFDFGEHLMFGFEHFLLFFFDILFSALFDDLKHATVGIFLEILVLGPDIDLEIREKLL